MCHAVVTDSVKPHQNQRKSDFRDAKHLWGVSGILVNGKDSTRPAQVDFVKSTWQTKSRDQEGKKRGGKESLVGQSVVDKLFEVDILYYYDQRFTGCHPSPQVVHWQRCSLIGNHIKFPYMGVRLMLDWKILTFFAYLGSEKLSVTVTSTKKVFSSRAAVTRHLNLWS
ncbi:hypothetical protein K438DRAFT_1753581 [Mycena galopus ATCC 62051]|nr:hypothetical protein K438DRAFT_1753581 [Mycena galopus ATCC 62051]